ncbi:GntR family transcriptional regulator, partial [Pseudomonas aeruginosa]|uniref:GntR family transcriptional regulator n=1 Tax=Pseudomonas aeruginosa TaxID=287 RepID=UPI0021F1DB98
MPVDQSRQYLRIRDQLAADIAQGVLQVKLPSERELAERFLCTRITLREALQQLETEGLVYRENRRGWFVAPPRIRYNPTRTTGFMEYVSAQGRQPRTETRGGPPRGGPPGGGRGGGGGGRRGGGVGSTRPRGGGRP